MNDLSNYNVSVFDGIKHINEYGQESHSPQKQRNPVFTAKADKYGVFLFLSCTQSVPFCTQNAPKISHISHEISHEITPNRCFM